MPDPAAGTWEAPGGHLSQDEQPRSAAIREWQEECGLAFPDGEWTGTWTSANGIYQGFVLTIPREADLDIFARRVGSDPDGDVDGSESIAWWDPADLPQNPAVRPELLASLEAVMAALGFTPDDGKVTPASVNYRPAEDPARCCGTCSMIRPDGNGGYACTLVEGEIDPGAACDEWHPAGEGAVAKAGGASAPKVPKRERPGPEPAWGAIEDRRARLTRKHLKAVLAAWNDLAGTLDSRALVRQYRAEVQPVAKYADPDRNKALDLTLAWLAALYAKKGWAALVAAIEDSIRSGMAEGEADALAVAAARQGVKGFKIDRAFAAAYERLADDGEISRQAADAARKMAEGVAAAVSGVLAAGAHDDSSDDETADAVDDETAGNGVPSVTSRLGDLIWGAIGAGIAWLCGLAGSGAPPPGPGEAPNPPPGPPQPPSPVFLNWVTDGNPCPACVNNEAGSPYAPQDLPSFPRHPRCQCEIVPADDIPSSFFAAYLLD